MAICKNCSTGRNFKINTPTTDVIKCQRKHFLVGQMDFLGIQKAEP